MWPGRSDRVARSLFNFAHIGQGLHLTGEPPFLHTMPELGGQRAGHTTIIVEKGASEEAAFIKSCPASAHRCRSPRA
jgi:hypothetical protein